MAGSAVITAVLSRFCMNSALATMAAVRRGSVRRGGAGGGASARPAGSVVMRAE